MSLSAGGSGGDGPPVRGDGTLLWGSILGTAVGSVVLAIFEGWITTILALLRVPVTWLQGLGDFFGAATRLIYGVPAAIISGSWDQVLPLVESAGILGFVVALAIVLTTLYIVAEVVSRL